MNQIKNEKQLHMATLLSLFLLVLSSQNVLAQESVGLRGNAQNRIAPSQPTTVRQNRPVIVHVKNGSPVRGMFLQADTDAVLVEVENARRLSIRLDEVTSMVFVADAASAAPKSSQSSSQATDAASEALKSLRSMAAATEVGINNRDYSNRLIEVKVVVEAALAKIPEGELKKEINAALSDYVDASKLWDLSLESLRGGSYATRSLDEKIREQMKVVLSNYWSSARKHIDRAASLSQ